MTTKIESIVHAHKAFIPAAGHHLFLPLYDPLVKLLGGDSARKQLVLQASIGTGERVLDVGCGTGTLALLMKKNQPDVDITGIDPDPRALGRAKRKSEKVGFDIRFDQGFAENLTYAEDSFDRVFSSFMFHHLQKEEKEGMLREVRRVLKPNGYFHLLDFHRPEQNRAGRFSRWIHSSRLLEDNSEAQVLALLRRANFTEASKVEEGTMLFWRTAFYRAS
ncbi:class I SAM-dependent methyltransferase [bacterium]|nr:class I SAM-dependent methyltransferase [bacterium]